MTKTARLHRVAEAEIVWVLGDRLRFAGALPGTPHVMIEVEVPPGSGVPPHRHASPELFRVLAGQVVFTAFEDGAPRRLTAEEGDVLGVPGDVPHGYANEGAAPARLLVVVDRAMEAFFRDVGAPHPPAGPPDEAAISRLMAACARHGISFVGAPGG